MHYSKLFPKTRREDPRDVPSPGTKLLIRAGLIHQVSQGIWAMTTLGLMVRRHAEAIVREEMNRIGAVELELPILQPRELWEETKRWAKYMASGTAFHLKDRKGHEFILSPTAEEVITDFARANLPSHHDLPATFWQTHVKFRDELRPRQGIVRSREFLMKDAYSFDANEAGMRRSYEAMDQAYRRVFERCGFHFIKVEADSGAIGGSGSAEFMALTEFGEDVLLHCSRCGYGGNQEKASAFFPPYPEVPFDELRKIETPDIRTVDQLAAFVGFSPAQMVKTIVLAADDNQVVVSMRGDLEISEVKLANLLGAEKVATADHATVERVTGAPVGFAGPIGLCGSANIPYYFDKSVEGMRNFLCGANQVDAHYIGVNAGRDFPEIPLYHDLSKAVVGSLCPVCKTERMEEKRGIELGHIFQLQQVYSKPMQATFRDANGEEIPYWMGCYGIGVSRIVQAIVEQSYDERGIIWPLALAPFQAVVMAAKQDHQHVAEDLYNQLTARGMNVVFDDRGDVRMGEKFADAELQGWPLQILVGRSWDAEKKLEVRWRNTRDFDRTVFHDVKPGSLPTALMDMEQIVSFMAQLNRNL